MTQDNQTSLRLNELSGITMGQFKKLVDTIKTRLREQDVLFTADKHGLCYHTLALFDFGTKPSFEDNDELDRQCLALLAKLGLDTEPTSIKSPRHEVMSELLGFQTTPRSERASLLEEALCNLSLVEANLVEMKTLPGIAEFLQNPSKPPRNQDERKHVDFYKRNLDKRAAIATYLVNGLDNEALRKAGRINSQLGLLGVDWAKVRSSQYLQTRLRPEDIETSYHRVLPLNTSDGRELCAIYKNGEQREFYEQRTNMCRHKKSSLNSKMRRKHSRASTDAAQYSRNFNNCSKQNFGMPSTR